MNIDYAPLEKEGRFFMNRKKKMYFLLFVVLVLLGVGIGFLSFSKKKPETTRSSFILTHMKAKGYTLLQQRKKEEALQYLRKASERDPEDQKLKSLVKVLESN